MFKRIEIAEGVVEISRGRFGVRAALLLPDGSILAVRSEDQPEDDFVIEFLREGLKEGRQISAAEIAAAKEGGARPRRLVAGLDGIRDNPIPRPIEGIPDQILGSFDAVVEISDDVMAPFNEAEEAFQRGDEKAVMAALSQIFGTPAKK